MLKFFGKPNYEREKQVLNDMFFPLNTIDVALHLSVCYCVIV